MFIIVFIITFWLFIEGLFYLTHRKPLDDSEINSLSQKRRKRYILQNYTFNIKSTPIDRDFKSKMNPKGKLYSVDLQLNSLPAYIASLLKGKKHEWVVLAIEGDGVAKYLWANKGFDSSSVSFNCNIEYIIALCKEHDCSTIIRFHNHPNSSPNTQTCFFGK